ncbi:MAG TPA: spore coat U domain-containing protein, partial [Variovorax sp.]|nr:spore coat U domain-containing protein [Variovorax sp.]
DSTSTITLNCPPNTAWWMGLNNGLHASGTQRRMIGPTGDLVSYELYRDNARAQRWGSTQGTDTVSGSGGSTASVTVYGRVPAQTGVTPGTYSDTITVTLTY